MTPGLLRRIAAGDERAALDPALATAKVSSGATRQNPKEWFLEEIRHVVYAGDTALHVAAAAHQTATVRQLVALGADPNARNRRGATPLHYAADGIPGWAGWPRAQAATVTALISAGADPNAADKGGVTPLHRAVRNRCAAAVAALLEAGADVRKKSKRGSTARQLAVATTGRGGSGSGEAKAQQTEIARLLRAAAKGSTSSGHIR